MTESTIAATRLIELSVEMNRQGLPLMQRVLPTHAAAEQWAHYPPDDAVSPKSGSRYFYHSHPPKEREVGEHGHFHLFLPLSLFSKESAVSAPPDDGSKRAEVVHFAALSVNSAGVPAQLFTVNRWVTDEWLFPAEAIMEHINAFDLGGADGDELVNGWLTAFVLLAKNDIAGLLGERDTVLAAMDWPGEDRSMETMSAKVIDLQALLERAFASA